MYLNTSDVSVIEAAAKREQLVRDARTRHNARLAGEESGHASHRGPRRRSWRKATSPS